MCDSYDIFLIFHDGHTGNQLFLKWWQCDSQIKHYLLHLILMPIFFFFVLRLFMKFFLELWGFKYWNLAILSGRFLQHGYKLFFHIATKCHDIEVILISKYNLHIDVIFGTCSIIVHLSFSYIYNLKQTPYLWSKLNVLKCYLAWRGFFHNQSNALIDTMVQSNSLKSMTSWITHFCITPVLWCLL